MALSENIRKKREQQKFTLEEVAESANVTKQAMSKYETGTAIPNGVVLVSIAQKLGTTAEALVKGKPEEIDK